MAIIPFKEYMHDDWEEREEVASWMGMDEMPEELWQKLGCPFYEICFDCTVDTDTGHVTIVGVAGKQLAEPIKLGY